MEVPPLETLSFKQEGKLEVLGAEMGHRRGSQGPMSRLVFSQNVLAAAQLLPQVGHLETQRGVLLLQEAGSDGNLVLFEAARVPRALRRHVVLSASRPVPIILQGAAEGSVSKTTWQ